MGNDKDRPIRTSGKALIIRDGKMLAIRLRDETGEFYILPGGGQEAGELLPDAVVREVAEETGIRVECGELLFVLEGAHGEPFHRVDLVFRCEYRSEIPDAQLHGDQTQVGYEWLDIAALNTAPLYPSRYRRAIMNYYENKPRAAYLGNEEMGDPECTD